MLCYAMLGRMHAFFARHVGLFIYIITPTSIEVCVVTQRRAGKADARSSSRDRVSSCLRYLPSTLPSHGHQATPIMLLLPSAMCMSLIVPPLQPPAAFVRSVPTTSTLAFIQPEFLGKPAASKDNPGGAGNAEGNWWTPSKVDPKDQAAKVAEIRARQSISELNGRYKVEKLEKSDKQQAERAAKQAAKNAELQAKREKYAVKAAK